MEQHLTNQKESGILFTFTTSRLKKVAVGQFLIKCLFALGILFSNNLIAQDKAGTFVLSGTIENSENTYLYLLYETASDVRLKDSSRIMDGKFQFEGMISEPTRATLRENSSLYVDGKFLADETNLNRVGIYLEARKMTAHVIHDRFGSILMSGSETQEEQVRHDELFLPDREKYVALRGQMEAAIKSKSPKEQIDSLSALSEKAITGMQSVTYQFIYDNPNSYVSAQYLRLYRNDWPLDTVKKLFDNFSSEIQQSSNGKEIADLIRAKESAAIGTMAYDFSGLELNGQPIKLSDLRGKFVLVDFWGSWCAPCREGNPHLIKLYNQYKDRNFEIIGVASQDKDVPWRNAVKKDKIGIWKNIIDTDTKSRGLEIAGKYGVYSFPTKFLIDKSGKIIGRFSGSDGKKLDELLAQQLK